MGYCYISAVKQKTRWIFKKCDGRDCYCCHHNVKRNCKNGNCKYHCDNRAVAVNAINALITLNTEVKL